MIFILTSKCLSLDECRNMEQLTFDVISMCCILIIKQVKSRNKNKIELDAKNLYFTKDLRLISIIILNGNGGIYVIY